MGITKRFIMCVTFLSILPATVYASWNDQSIIINGNFGSTGEQFGFLSGDIVDELPEILSILSDGKILIYDVVNGNNKLFSSSGIFIKTIPYLGAKIIEITPDKVYAFKFDLSEKATYPGVFNINKNDWEWFDKSNNVGPSSDILVAISNGDIILWKNSGYKYSQFGNVIAKYNKKPFEFGIKTVSTNSDEKYITNVMYYDQTYEIVLDGDFDNYVRDADKNIYFYNVYTEIDPVSGQESHASFVLRYDRCGKFSGKLVLPISEYEPITQDEMKMPTTRMTARNEYGPPVVGPDGSVYAWKRTPTTYSILKWTWVDSPDDPKGGPDAPSALKVAPATTGLYLTWTASPQDPGCVDGYEVERSSTSGGIFSNITTTAPGVVSYSDTGVLPGNSAFYRVRAKSSCGPSDYTAVIGGTRP